MKTKMAVLLIVVFSVLISVAAKPATNAAPTHIWGAYVPAGVTNPPQQAVYDPVSEERMNTAILAERARQSGYERQIERNTYGYGGYGYPYGSYSRYSYYPSYGYGGYGYPNYRTYSTSIGIGFGIGFGGVHSYRYGSSYGGRSYGNHNYRTSSHNQVRVGSHGRPPTNTHRR